MKTLEEWKKDLKLTEKELLVCCQNGKMAVIGEERPSEKIEANEIRAEFLRWLILTKEVEIDPMGIQVQCAWISGSLNLENVVCEKILLFDECYFDEIVYLRRSITKSIYLDGSFCQKGISGDGLVCHGNLHLRNSFEAHEEVRFVGAKVEGNFSCKQAIFKALNQEQKALVCDGIVVNRLVSLSGSSAEGEVRFLGAKVGGNFICKQATFKALNEEQKALHCDRIGVNGTVFLNGSSAEGEVRFVGAKVKGNFSCRQAKFKANSEDKKALNCDGIKIISSIFLHQNCTIEVGYVNFTSACIGALVDDKAFWQQKTLKDIRVNGFKYDHIYTDDITAFFRLKNMLGKMPKFKPQPYRQLSKVLRDMGHDRDADEVMMALRDKQLEKSNESLGYKCLRRVYKWTSGYGYRPIRALGIMFFLWLACGAFYEYSAKRAVFAPTNPLIYKPMYQDQPQETNCTLAVNGTPWFASAEDYNTSKNNWYYATHAEYTTFQPYWYSLDILLPIVDLKMENDWSVAIPSPNGSFFETFNYCVRLMVWIETLLGWIFSLMLVAILSGLAKNEKE